MSDSREPLNKTLPSHKGMATMGGRMVPLEEFRRAASSFGRSLAPDQRERARRARLEPVEDRTPVEGPYRRVAVFGGVYSNHQALAALLEDARRRGAEALYCLGDLGGFGPNPEKVWPLLGQGEVRCIQGNYEASLASGAEDCGCGYTDPRDNHFAELSYSYTARSCSAAFKEWMGSLPARRRIRVGHRELLLVHGSPRRTNEFLFRSTSPDPFLGMLLRRHRCEGILCTHTGLHWQHRLPGGGDVVNVGVIGRPANDGRTNVWYAMLEAGRQGLEVELLPLRYDYESLAAEMKAEKLPEPFIETILTGWWTSCLEILPAKERAAGRF